MNSSHLSPLTSHYLIRYAEIALKGRNRRWFEQKLINNIKTLLTSHLSPLTIKVHHLHSQLLLEIKNQNPSHLSLLTSYLSKIFGIAWFAPVTVSSLDLAQITASSLSLLASSLSLKPSKRQKAKGKRPITFAVRVTRHDKSYPLTSRQLEIKIGSAILSHFNQQPATNNKQQKSTSHHLKVDLTNPNLTLYIDILKDRALLYTEKIPGPGGLPVGTAGKALCLLSGGFDSVAAAYLMAKRGLKIDFIHFHVFADSNYLKQTKIWPIATHLAPIVGAKTLYAAAYTPFQLKLMQLDPKHQKHELILFRRWMFRTAAQFAAQHGYQAIISGDSLGQVASQTLSNLAAVDEVLKQKAKGQRQKANPPLFRPLIGMDKKEIIDLVKHIGLYDEVIKPYKDCCSLVSKKPATRANLKTIHQLEKDLSLPTLQPQISSIYIGS